MEDWPKMIKAGGVFALLCFDINVGLAALKSELDGSGRRVCTLRWVRPQRTGSLIDEAVAGLARISLALWPNWPESDEKHVRPGSQAEANNATAQHPTRAFTTALSAWRDAAGRLCSAGELPLPTEYPASTQAAQLALTVAPNGLVIVLVVERAGGANQATVLRAAAEWLASNTGASVILMLSSDAADSSDLKKVVPSLEFPEPFSSAQAAQNESEQPTVDLFPVTGLPHPLSAGEQKLAAQLMADVELTHLFAF